MTIRIGIVGGYGAVGAAAARLLHRARPAEDFELRIGGRRAQEAARFAQQELGGAAEAVAVDVFDNESLRSFCDGCDLVVNASAASYLVVDRVAQAALAAGADYADAGGDLPLYDKLNAMDLPGQGRRALVTAGMMPGLTGLLPRWLAQQSTAEPRRLIAHVGVMDRLTPAGAVDYLLSLRDRDEESQAIWLDGRRVTRAATAIADAELPFFPGRVTAYPYLGYEGQRLAVELGLSEVRWHAVFDGGATLMATLSRLQGAMSGQSDLQIAAQELAAAAELDMFGKEPYQLMVFELSTSEGTQTLMVRSDDTSVLTGTVLGLATLQLLHKQVPAGAHFAAEALDAVALVEALNQTGAVRAFEVFDGAAADVATVEEGAL